MNRTKLAATVSLTIAVITMVTSNQLPIYASPTTEDDGCVEGDYEGSQEEQEEQAQEDWEDAGRPGDNDDNGDNDNDIKDNDDLPICKLGVVQDCETEYSMVCEVGTGDDPCQDIYGGVSGTAERDEEGQLIDKPNPYCEKLEKRYQMKIGLKNEMISNLNQQLNQKSYALEEKLTGAMTQAN